jgi:hypothetical protein
MSKRTWGVVLIALATYLNGGIIPIVNVDTSGIVQTVEGWLGGLHIGSELDPPVSVLMTYNAADKADETKYPTAAREAVDANSPGSVWAWCQSHCGTDSLTVSGQQINQLAARRMQAGDPTQLDVPWLAKLMPVISVLPQPAIGVVTKSGKVYSAHITDTPTTLAFLAKYGGK